MSFAYRSLMPFEFGLYAAHLKRLSDADRYMRFEAVTSDEGIDRYVDRIVLSRSAIIGVFDAEGVMRGAAHVVRDGTVTDLGLSVEAEFRGIGLGLRLLDEAISSARLLGARAFTALCLARNGWMTRQLKKRGFEMTHDGGCMLASSPLRPANPGLLAAAIWRDHLGWARSFSLAAYGSARKMLASVLPGRETPAA